MKRRGPSDKAYSQEKLSELSNNKRPYPFLYGLLSSMQYRYPHPHPYQNQGYGQTGMISGGSHIQVMPQRTMADHPQQKDYSHPVEPPRSVSVYPYSNIPVISGSSPKPVKADCCNFSLHGSAYKTQQNQDVRTIATPPMRSLDPSVMNLALEIPDILPNVSPSSRTYPYPPMNFYSSGHFHHQQRFSPLPYINGGVI